ncbi:MAG: 4-carboxymuconolactone decarboxylase [Pseudomonadota bacterium]
MHAIRLNGHLTAYRHRPSGARTIVFVHGPGSDHCLWDQVIRFLGRGYGTLTYDLPGHGASEPCAPDTSCAGLARDLIALIEHLDLSDVLLCAVSGGGQVAQAVAAARPDLLCGLVLNGCGPNMGFLTDWADMAARDGMAGASDPIVDQWIPASYRDREPDLSAMHRLRLSKTCQSSFAALCVVLGSADFSLARPLMAIPVLCLTGAEDRLVAALDAFGLSAEFPNGACEKITDSAHLAPIATPAQMAVSIEAFDQNNTSKMTRGSAVRRGVLGQAHVDRTAAAVTSLDRDFQKMIVESAWGTVWAGNAISRRERSMLTLALLAATGNFNEIPMHVRATRATGASERDVAEAFQHVAIYAGVPRANHALKLAKQTFSEMAEDD